jgi:AraC family transcriptional regulator, alkane utilization regulator
MRVSSSFMSERSNVEGHCLIMDCLSDALNNIRFKSTVYGVSELTAPWGLRIDPEKGHLSFLAPVRGSCIATFDGMPAPFVLSGGELLVAPKGIGCTLQDAASSDVILIKEASRLYPPTNGVFRFGGGGALTSMLMGCFQLESFGTNPLLASLPGAIYLNTTQLQSEPWLEATVRLLIAEAGQARPGSDILVGRLADILFIQTIRAYMSQVSRCPESTGWLKAISDTHLGPALCLIHERPEAPWTVDSLANSVGMSRTSFATKFAAAVSASPIEYLTSWRMQKALRMMAEGEDNLATISSAVGYTSEPAFSKAFKRVIGESPGGFRKKLIS